MRKGDLGEFVSEMEQKQFFYKCRAYGNVLDAIRLIVIPQSGTFIDAGGFLRDNQYNSVKSP